MKAGTHNHLKVKRLKRALQRPLFQVVGVLETLWLLCSDCCDQGDIGKYTDEEIAEYLEWDGDPSELVSALVDCGWIDPCESSRYVVHDWLDHCPEFIKDRIRKRQLRGSKPKKITTYVSSETDKPGIAPECPVYSKAGQGNSNPTKPNQGRRRAATDPASPVVFPPELDFDDFKIVWNSWADYRKEKKKALTKTTIEHQLRQLSKWGKERAIKAIEYTIFKGWEGLREPDEAQPARSHQKAPDL